MGVYFRCKICAREHRLPANIARRDIFESSSGQAKTVQCSATGRSAIYSKGDMRWKDNK